MPNWTPEQQDVLTDRGHSLIVCAAAGSGKTAVLVERIVRLVLEGCPVDRMLVVTFTNAAAAEMRLRISDALCSAARVHPELAAQNAALSRASISTLHHFCGTLLREHFQALGIDPAFRVGDDQECGVLSAQAMEDALYACYETSDADFLAADARFDQDTLAAIALDLHRFMMTRPDPWRWLDDAIASSAPGTLEDHACVRILLEHTAADLSQLADDVAQTLALCQSPGGPAHYIDAVMQDASLIEGLQKAAQDGYDALRRALLSIAYAKLGRKKKNDEFDEDIGKQVKDRRDRMKKQLASLADRFSPTLDEAAADLALMQSPLRGIALLTRTYHALFTAAKRQRNLLDFDDLEHGALQALEHAEVRDALRKKYRYVFVDEYQDSSAIQEAILGSFAREDGLFLVGDVKQSIYRFRQAEPSLFLNRAARFDQPDDPLTRRIDLQRNFRSRANVLEAVNAVFSRIMRADATEIDYGAREKLIPGLTCEGDDPPVELHVILRDDDDSGETDSDAEDDERDLAAAEREALIAAKRIRALVGTPYFDAKAGTTRPLAYRDMAVLMRTARGAAPLAADILRAEGIPVFCDAGEGYFEIPEIRAIMALLTAIENGARDSALIAALRGPACALSDDELAAIRIATPDSRIPYHEAVRAYREQKTDALSEKLKAFDSKLARWRLVAQHQGVDRLIERIYAETNFLAYAGALPGGTSRQANLHLLTTRARTFMQTQGGSLHAFLHYARRLRAGGDRMSASALGENEDVVRIMTAHKSKGLEFPVVFVLGLGHKLGGAQRGVALFSARLGIGLPCVDTALGSERDTILRRAIRLETQREALAEEVRILYVAMTRARDRLILVGDAGSRIDNPPVRDIQRGLDMVCPTLVEAGACLTLPEEMVDAGASHWRVCVHHEMQAGMFSQRTDERVRETLSALHSAKGETDKELPALLAFNPESGRAPAHKTSVSALLRAEQMRRDEDGQIRPAYAEMIKPLPRFMQQQRMTGAQIGTAFHRMMRMLDLDALRHAQDLRAELSRQVEAMRGNVLTQAEANAVPPRMAIGFFEDPVGMRLLASSRVEREWPFTWRRTMEDGNAQLLQGVVDCCFMEGGKWVLVDYKTDSPSDVSGALARHRPQLALYAEALEHLTGTTVQERVLFLVRAGRGYLC